MKNTLYIILFLGIIPATWILCLTVFGILMVLSNADFSIDYFLAIISMTLGIFGYIGLLTLFKGLHKTNHIKKLILLFSGLIGFLIFMFQISPRNLSDWILDSDLGSLIGKLPIIVTIIFLTLTVVDFIKIKMLVKDK